VTLNATDLGIIGANWTTGQDLSFDQTLAATGLASLIPESGTATIFAMVLICTVRRRRAFN
tara:strand:- start:504 stop:686 length:183 start_codon:yes stop_codon:yes gene_type:complete